MGVGGVGDRVTGRRGELVGAQGILSARWLVCVKRQRRQKWLPPFFLKEPERVREPQFKITVNVYSSYGGLRSA